MLFCGLRIDLRNLDMTLLKINKTDIRIRPSAVDGFYSCSYQWAKRFLEGVPQGPNNSRASIGTAIHAGAEQLWSDVMKSRDREAYNLSAMADAAMESFKEQQKEGVKFDLGETENTAAVEIVRGVESFATDIAQFVPIPIAVEEYFEVKIDHPLVIAVGGTIDYLAENSISDIKTSKRALTPSGYVVQQSIYKYLAEANGHTVNLNTIQGIVLRKNNADGMVLPLETNVPQAKFLINGILDRLDLAMADTAPLEVLFPGNPKYYLCSNKYCEQYATCPFVNGKDTKKIQIAL
jgi:hypothetical protein